MPYLITKQCPFTQLPSEFTYYYSNTSNYKSLIMILLNAQGKDFTEGKVLENEYQCSLALQQRLVDPISENSANYSCKAKLHGQEHGHLKQKPPNFPVPMSPLPNKTEY